MSYRLFIDDDSGKPNVQEFRNPPPGETDWKVAHSSKEAKLIVKEFGIPTFLQLDHDLGEFPFGGLDTTMDFLHWLEHYYPDAIDSIEGWDVHSLNPTGAKNIDSFLNSWRKSRILP